MSIRHAKPQEIKEKGTIIEYALPGGSIQRDTRELKNANRNIKKRLAAKQRIKAQRFLVK